MRHLLQIIELLLLASPVPSPSLQQHFADCLLDPQAALPAALGGGQQQRFAVYRNNVATSLIEALREGFAAVNSLIGEEAFTNLARRYVRKCPPQSPVLLYYGDAFATYIASLQELSHLPYLADIARLDYARRMSYHARDADMSSHNDPPPHELASAQPVLNPSMQLVASPYPIYDIWRHAHGLGKQQHTHAQTVLALRKQGEVDLHLLDACVVDFFLLLDTHHRDPASFANLGAIAEQALANNPDSDITAALGFALQHKAIIGFMPA